MRTEKFVNQNIRNKKSPPNTILCYLVFIENNPNCMNKLQHRQNSEIKKICLFHVGLRHAENVMISGSSFK